MSLLVEHGGVSSTVSRAFGAECWFSAAILHEAAENEPPVSEEKKAVFYASAEFNVRYLLLQLLSKILIFSIQGRASPARHTPRIDKV